MSATTKTSLVKRISTKDLLRSSALTAAGLIAFALPAHADRTDPTGGTVTVGSSTTSAVAGGFITNDTSNVVVTEYGKSLLIRNGETWTINQLSSDSISAHRVLNKDAFNTLINGSINANGNFILIDPNGILVGQNGSIDANGVLLTTGNISNSQLTNNAFGQYTITDATEGAIDIRGTVTVAEAGLAAFVAPTVINRGVINAKLGKVAFASGEVVTLDLYGDQLVEIEVAGDVADALLLNTAGGEINAKGGVVQMTADQAKVAVDNVINVNGVVNVASATVKGGKIVLSGGEKGTVRVNGELRTAGVDAGDIEISGENVNITQNAILNANGRSGGAGGNIMMAAINDLRFRGRALAKGDALGGIGGSITLTGATGRIDGVLNASAAADANGSITLTGNNACITSGPACAGVPATDALSIVKSVVEDSLSRGTDVSVVAQGANGNVSVRDNLDTATASIATLSLIANDDVIVNGNVTDTGAGLNMLLTAGAGDVAGGTQSDVIINGAINTNGGDFTATADRNVDINNIVNTGAGIATLNATGNYDGGTSVIRLDSAGSITASGINLIAQDMDIDQAASIDAGTGTISITRSTEGTIGLGGGAGDMRLSQRELDTLSAGKVEIGNADEASSNTTDINVDTVDLSAISAVELNALAPAGGINFAGPSTFAGLEVNAKTTDVNAAITANAIEFNSDVVNLDADLISDNISGSSDTINVLGSTNGAEVQDGIDIAGTDATVNLAAGTYIENITIDKEGLDLIGANGATIQAAIAGQALVTVVAEDVTIDPITFDGAGIVDYGIYADGVGSSGLLVDGNTFRNFNEAGVFVRNVSAGGTTTISNNIFEASSRTGIETGRIDGGATLDILNNTFGSIAARIRHGILFGRIGNATVNVTDGATHSIRDAIRFNDGLRSGANVTLTNLTLDSRDREAVQTNSIIRSGSNLTITGGTLNGGDNGIQIGDVVGALTIQNATITGGSDGILFDGEVRNGAQVTIDSNSVTATNDAIKFDDPIEGAGTVVTISNNTDLIGGDNGILFNGEIRDGAVVNVTGNTNIEGQLLDGVVVKDDIDGATLNISGNSISGLENGIAAESLNLENGATINITNNTSINGTNGEAVIIDDSVQGGVALTISGNLNITAGNDGIAVVDVSDAQILNNTVTSAGDDAIDLKNSDGSDVLGNTLSGFANDGVFASDSDNVSISAANTITGGTNAVRVQTSDSATVNGNTISGQSADGIILDSSDSATVSGNDISNIGDDGIDVINGSDDVTITLNTITNVADSAITVRANSQSPFIQDNVITGARNGIRVTGTAGQKNLGAEIDDNDVTGTTDNAIWLDHTTNASVTDNVIDSATGTGVRLANSSNAVIGGDDASNRNTVHNRISNVENAVIVENSSAVVVGQNDVTDVTNGITITGGDTITVEDNNMTGSGIGIDVDGTTNAIIGGSTSNGNELDNFNIAIRSTNADNVQISHNQINVNGNTNDSTVGIQINGGNSVDVDQNRIDDTTVDAIQANNTTFIDIDDNVITDTADGIYVTGGLNADIRRNNVNGATDDGIQVLSHNDVDIENNIVANAADSGITVLDSNDARIITNNVDDVRNGVRVTNGADAEIRGNQIDDASNAGITVTNNDDAQIVSNQINVNGNSTNSAIGIEVNGGNSVDIDNNRVDDTFGGGTSILVTNAPFVDIDNNVITDTTNGIVVSGGTDADIRDNQLNNVSSVAIDVTNNDNAQILRNLINVGGNAIASAIGIRVNGGNSVDVDANRIDDTSSAAIEANNTTFIDIDDNIITDAQDGIVVTGGQNADIRRNNITDANDDGIQISDHDNVDIENNVITDVIDAAITVFNGSDNARIIENDINDATNGIRVVGGTNAEIRGNETDNTFRASNIAISVTDNNDAQILGNEINVNGNNVFAPSNVGIQVSGGENVDVIGNRIDDTWNNGTSIVATNTTSIDIDNNIITDTTNGIVVDGGTGANVRDNQLNNVSSVAIDVTNNDNAQILRNLINVGGNAIASAIGIRVNGGNSVDIDNNRIDDINGDAIQANNTTFIDIDENIITDTGDGIVVSGGLNADIRRNNIDGATDDGIQIINHANVDVENNIIADVADTAIIVEGGSNNARIIENNIDDTVDGITVIGGADAEIRGNEIDDASNIAITVTNNANAQILSNLINTDGNTIDAVTGILVNGGDNVNVANNMVDDTSLTGINALNTTNVQIDTNTVTDAADGIKVQNGSDATVNGNTVTGTSDDGIQIDNSINATVTNNIVSDNGDAGIIIGNNSDGAAVRLNTVSNASDGIRITSSDNVTVARNSASDNRGDGIDASNADNLTVNRNRANRNGDNGIEISSSDNVTLRGNRANRNDDNGIRIDSGSSDVTLTNNRANRNGDDGIDVKDSADITLTNNTANRNGDDGIDADNSTNLVLQGNTSNRNGDDGVDLNGITDLTVNGGTSSLNGDDGIDVKNSANVTLTGNTTNSNSDDGIDADGSNNVTIQGNTGNFNVSNGLSIDGSTSVTVDSSNTFSSNGEDGIQVGQKSSDITITDNLVENNGNAGINIIDTDDFTVSANTATGNDVGIELTRATNGELSANTIDGSLTTGIEVNESDAINVLGNDVSNSGVQGFYAQGALNGDIVLAENTFTDNDLGALFESGNIDLTGGANTFTGGTTGMRFAPVGLPTDVSLVGNTFGTTIFSGQTDNYIELANGALFAPGTPTILDATNVNFDGIVPSSFPTNGLGQPILPPATLDAIENKLFDFDNLGTLGQIFVGVDLTLNNFEDFIRAFDPALVDPSAVNVTLLGLPRLSLDPNALANIAPAAGGEADGSDVAAIEPAAGGESVNCWSDAVGGSAAVSTFTFGGTFADSIASESAGCGSEGL